MKKRMIAMFLAVTMIFTILPANAFAADGRSAVPEGQETDDRPGSIKEWLEQNRGLDGEADVPELGETPSHLTPRSIEAPVLSGKIEASPHILGKPTLYTTDWSKPASALPWQRYPERDKRHEMAPAGIHQRSSVSEQRMRDVSIR